MRSYVYRKYITFSFFLCYLLFSCQTISIADSSSDNRSLLIPSSLLCKKIFTIHWPIPKILQSTIKPLKRLLPKHSPGFFCMCSWRFLPLTAAGHTHLSLLFPRPSRSISSGTKIRVHRLLPPPCMTPFLMRVKFGRLIPIQNTVCGQPSSAASQPRNMKQPCAFSRPIRRSQNTLWNLSPQ